MKDLTLIIMAAGMGSRFGGLKQIEPIGPNNEFILDYSVYDAIKAGFTKVIFIIKEENYELFRDTVGKRIENKIKVSYVFQDMTDLPAGFTITDRVKPWGTGHAIRAARNEVSGPFAAINADDFYGFDAFAKIADFLKNVDESNPIHQYAIIGYLLRNTLSLNGSVKRGVCKVENNYLKTFIECKVERVNGTMIATPLDGNILPFECDEDQVASMSIFGFTRNIIDEIEKQFAEFLNKNKDNYETCEFLLPDVVENEIKDKTCEVTIIPTDAIWYGVTYREDKETVVNAINDMINKGIYPKDLWS